MEALAPWLLTAVAALLLASVVLYYHLRQVESAAEGRHSLFNDTLRDAITDLAQPPAAAGDWRPRAVRLAAGGFTAAQIARELQAPLGEVELVVSLAQPSRSR